MVSESTGADVKASRTLRVIASAAAAREGQHTGPMDIPGFFDDDPLMKTIPIWFSSQVVDDQEINAVLPFLNMDKIEDCGINEFVFLVKTGARRPIAPPLGELNDFWAPWDEPLEEESRFHLLIAS